MLSPCYNSDMDVSCYSLCWKCCLLFMDVVSFYIFLLWMLSPFTIFYYGCRLLYNILYGCCLLGFYSFLYASRCFRQRQSINCHTYRYRTAVFIFTVFLCRCTSFLTKTMSREELTLLNLVSLFLLKQIII